MTKIRDSKGGEDSCRSYQTTSSMTQKVKILKVNKQKVFDNKKTLKDREEDKDS